MPAKNPPKPVTEQRVRTIVREEFTVFEEKMDRKLNSLEVKLDEKWEKRMQKYVDIVYGLVDSVLQEIKEMRIEYATTAQLVPRLREEVNNHEERIEKLEQGVDKK